MGIDKEYCHIEKLAGLDELIDSAQFSAQDEQRRLTRPAVEGQHRVQSDFGQGGAPMALCF